jgi:Spy/CpxP family protein refolding chaperone
MEAETASARTARKARTLDEEIAHQREKLRKLEERQREQQRREREKNQKAVHELIKAERLDTVPAERWRAVMPKLKALLVVEPEPVKKPQAGTP